jgi:hypothetical protein
LLALPNECFSFSIFSILQWSQGGNHPLVDLRKKNGYYQNMTGIFLKYPCTF